MSRPPRPNPELSSGELVETFATVPTGSTAEEIRAEADEFFGETDAIGDDDPWERSRG